MGRTSHICFPFVQLNADEISIVYVLVGRFRLAVCAYRFVRYTLGDNMGFEPCFRLPDRRATRTLSLVLDASSLSN